MLIEYKSAVLKLRYCIGLYQVTQKMSHLTKCNFWTIIEIFTDISGFIAKSFQQSLKISPKYFHCVKIRITAFTIFDSEFQNSAEELHSHLLWSMFNVVKQFFSKHILNFHPIFHISSMSFCEAECGFV